MTDDVEDLIEKVNRAELYRLRTIRGQDFNEWHATISDWVRSGEVGKALDLLREITAAAERLQQYDEREPNGYWTAQLSILFRRQKRYAEEVAAIERWMTFWPPGRPSSNRQRDTLTTRLTIARKLLLIGHPRDNRPNQDPPHQAHPQKLVPDMGGSEHQGSPEAGEGPAHHPPGRHGSYPGIAGPPSGQEVIPGLEL